jgi:hypothetical protein
MFHMPTQPKPYAAMVHSSMYRKGAMGMSVTRLNTVAAKPFLQAQHSGEAHTRKQIHFVNMHTVMMQCDRRLLLQGMYWDAGCLYNC